MNYLIDKNYHLILISFVIGFITAYVTIYNINQEDYSYTVEVADYYEFCKNEFSTKDYIDGFFNNFDLENYIDNIISYCIDNTL